MKFGRTNRINGLLGAAFLVTAMLTPVSSFAEGAWSAVASSCVIASDSTQVGATSQSDVLNKVDVGPGPAVSLKAGVLGFVVLRCNVTTGHSSFNPSRLGITYVDEYGSYGLPGAGALPLAPHGYVEAKLFKMENATGAQTMVASISSLRAGPIIKTAPQQLITPACSLPRLNFDRFSYWVELKVFRSSTGVNPKALGAQLFDETCGEFGPNAPIF